METVSHILSSTHILFYHLWRHLSSPLASKENNFTAIWNAAKIAFLNSWILLIFWNFMAPFGVLLILKILTNSLDYTNFSDLLSDLFDKLNGNKEVQLRNMTKEKSFWKNIYNNFGILLLLSILSIFYFSIIFKARKFRLDETLFWVFTIDNILFLLNLCIIKTWIVKSSNSSGARIQLIFPSIFQRIYFFRQG